MIGNKWDVLLKEEYEKEYFKNLLDFIKKEYKEKYSIDICAEKYYDAYKKILSTW